MNKCAPGKSYCKGLSFVEIADLFPTDEAAVDWMAAAR